MTPLINVKAFKCNRCQHVWLSKKYLEDGKTRPIACARCKSPYYDRPVIEGVKKERNKK